VKLQLHSAHNPNSGSGLGRNVTLWELQHLPVLISEFGMSWSSTELFGFDGLVKEAELVRGDASQSHGNHLLVEVR
jgi:hypothetical protein